MRNNFKKFINQIIPISEKEFDETDTFFQEQTLQKGYFFVKQGRIYQQIDLLIMELGAK